MEPSWDMSHAHFEFVWLQEEPDWLQVAPSWLQVAPQAPPDRPRMAPVTGYTSRLDTKINVGRKYDYWVEIKYGQNLPHPGLGQKSKF